MRKIICFVFAVVLILTCSTAFSQSFIMVMKALDGTTKLNGESTVAGHGGEIDLYSYSQGVSNCGNINCVTSISDFSFMTKFTGATIAFKRLSLTGTKLPSVDITFIRPSATAFVFLKIHMEDVFVTSVQESGSAGGDNTPTVAVSLNSVRIAWQYTLQKSDGTVGTKTTYGWDVSQNKPWTFAF
jgi:type VI secretion system secreted protein Hcp